jgi:hypothetical protein
LNVFNIVPDVLNTVEDAKCGINTSLNLEDIDRPIKFVGALLDLTADGFDEED